MFSYCLIAAGSGNADSLTVLFRLLFLPLPSFLIIALYSSLLFSSSLFPYCSISFLFGELIVYPLPIICMVNYLEQLCRCSTGLLRNNVTQPLNGRLTGRAIDPVLHASLQAIENYFVEISFQVGLFELQLKNCFRCDQLESWFAVVQGMQAWSIECGGSVIRPRIPAWKLTVRTLLVGTSWHLSVVRKVQKDKSHGRMLFLSIQDKCSIDRDSFPWQRC
ncbi:hypothetical protein V8C34DRAFT_294319 [Trichoderma compactum]